MTCSHRVIVMAVSLSVFFRGPLDTTKIKYLKQSSSTVHRVPSWFPVRMDIKL